MDVHKLVQNGGDAYTGIQNAAAQTAVNIYYLADIVRTGLFAFLLVFGIALICFFLSRINIDVKLIVKKEDKCEKKEASAASVALPATAPDDTVTVVEQNETEAVEHN